MQSKVLITGGLGFIFSHVTEHMVKQGYEVVVIDNESEGSHPEIIDGSFKYYKYNVSDPAVISIVLKEKPDYIIHAAAYSDVDKSIQKPLEVMSANIIANINMFEAARLLPSLKKFVYVSTDEVYGECESRKKEDELLFPKNPYACSKAVGSMIRMSYDNTYSQLRDKTAETRFCNVFGPRQDNRKVLPAIKEAMYGSVLPLHNDGKGFREYIYVKNIPSVVELIMLKGDRTYNVTLNDGFTVKGLIEQVESLSSRKVRTEPSNRPGMDLKYQMNNARIKKLGWKPLYSFTEGLTEYLNEAL